MTSGSDSKNVLIEPIKTSGGQSKLCPIYNLFFGVLENAIDIIANIILRLHYVPGGPGSPVC